MKIKILAIFFSICLIKLYPQGYPEWMTFNVNNSILPTNEITAIAADQNNNVWIGTADGLVNYNGNNFTLYNISNGLANNYVTAIAVDNNNTVWIIDSLLSSFNGMKWTHYEIPHFNGLPVYARKMIVDSSNTLWMIRLQKISFYENQNGIISFKDSIFTIYDYEHAGVGLTWVNCIASYKDEIWLGGWHLLVKYKDNVWKNCVWDSLSQSNITPVITDLEIDDDGNKWIGSYIERGNPDANWNEIFIFKLVGDNKYYNITEELTNLYNIADGMTSCLRIDSNGNRWIGVYYYGLFKLTDSGGQHYNTGNSEIQSNHIGYLAFDNTNNKWMASTYNWYHNGVSVFNENGLVLSSDNSNIWTRYEFNLYQNYPNPFNPKTTITFSLPSTSNVKVEVFDILGNKIKTLLDEERSEGRHELEFHCANLSSGIYFYRLTTEKFSDAKKLILIK